MIYEIIDAPNLPKGLRPGDQRDWQRPVVTAMSGQVGLPHHRWLHPVGHGEHYTSREDFNDGDEFFTDAFRLPESPTVATPKTAAEPDASETADALRKAEKALGSAQEDLQDTREQVRQARLVAVLRDDSESRAAMEVAVKLHRVRRDRLHRREVERLEAEQVHETTITGDETESAELLQCAAELRELVEIANARDLWSLLELPERDHGMAVYFVGPGGRRVADRLRELLANYLVLTDRTISVASALDTQPDIAMLVDKPQPETQEPS
jgi:hypothetical protein